MSPAGTAPRVRYTALACTVAAAIAGVLTGVALSATGPVTGVADVSGAVSVGIPLTRALFDLAAVVTVGLAVLPVLVGADQHRTAEPVLARARIGTVAGALVWTTTALVLLVLQTAEFRPGAATIGLGDIRDYAGSLAAGKALLVVTGLTLGLAGLGLLRIRLGERVPPEFPIGLGLLALLPLPVTGHAAGTALGDLTMISMELHVLSAVAWTGGLGAMAMLLLGNRVLLAGALPRFSRLATVCLLVSAATGLFNGLAEIVLNPAVEPLPGLFTTAYGRLVLLKVLCLGAIAALGAHVRWRLLPRIERREHTALATWVSAELLVMGLAFGLAAVLARAPVN
ncbi:putative copper resistance protein D [Prauserella shujinwangii]|uniref:Putative copper resistance protein D n=1 Tax=Prauserella shujinwangii TaxID=1453103 RepID=A0A2T0LVH9_9PSEU|nr:CopD family protein [Prauserella shujinwangii]PRX47818.1 putative copper resistance protein D [Prauserella shujinwangii]